VVHGHRVLRGHRLAGDRLVRGPGHALRRPRQYNQWVKHKIKFDSPWCVRRRPEFDKLLFTQGNVLGGRKSIASTNFGTAGNPMFDPKPGCCLYKQGSFITTFFPKNVQADLPAKRRLLLPARESRWREADPRWRRHGRPAEATAPAPARS
jgi:hypothetical protein